MSAAPQPVVTLPGATTRETRDGLRMARERLAAAFLERRGRGHGAHQFVRGLCSATDEALRTMWRAAGLPPELTLLAVGGYGRGELFPGSDVDILILLPAAPYAELGALLERFVGDLWDIGVELGHSVRTLEQCAEEAGRDITIATALLEARCIEGSRKLFNRFEREVRAGIDPQAFLVAKRL
ncbi:MAG: nucleotidyltransferase domain-containing protein, partial [Burkholderiales bacterium]